MSLTHIRQKPIGELYEFETADGLKLPLSGKVWMLNNAGFGMPPIGYEVRQAYKQDGVSLIDYQLQQRNFLVEIYYKGTEDRQEYWQNRERLLNIFRPNRGGNVTMKIVRHDLTKRSIEVRLAGGLEFETESANNNNWDIGASLELVAFNPTWFDSDETSIELAGESGDELVFPITFDDENIIFGIAGFIFGTGDLAYQGTWETYPIITLTGQYDSAVIENTATGISATLAVPIPSNATRIIDFTPGSVSVLDGNGDSKFNELDINSNMRLAILPDSELGGATQAIQITMTNTDSNSAVIIEYKTRYIGI